MEFVRDYLQLRFDGPTLSVYQMPIVQVGEAAYQQGQPGYLEAIVGVIGERLTRAEWRRGSNLTVLFGTDRRLVFPAVEHGGPAVSTFPTGSGTSTRAGPPSTARPPPGHGRPRHPVTPRPYPGPAQALSGETGVAGGSLGEQLVGLDSRPCAFDVVGSDGGPTRSPA